MDDVILSVFVVLVRPMYLNFSPVSDFVLKYYGCWSGGFFLLFREKKDEAAIIHIV